MKEQPMSDEKTMGQVIQIDESRIRDHLGEMVRGTVEETLNAMLDAEADRLCGAARYERSNLVGSECQPGPGHAVKARQDGPGRCLIVTQLVVATVHIFALQCGRKRWHCRDCRKESAKKSDERSNKIKLVCHTGDAHRHIHWQTKLSGVTCIWLTNKTRIICL